MSAGSGARAACLSLLSVSLSSALLLPLPLAAAPRAAVSAPAARDGADALAEVVVTASRVAENLDDSLSSVTVIRRDDIARAQARTVEELLAGVEGIAVAGGGGLGKVSSVFVLCSAGGPILAIGVSRYLHQNRAEFFSAAAEIPPPLPISPELTTLND